MLEDEKSDLLREIGYPKLRPLTSFDGETLDRLREAAEPSYWFGGYCYFDVVNALAERRGDPLPYVSPTRSGWMEAIYSAAGRTPPVRQKGVRQPRPIHYAIPAGRTGRWR